MDALFQQPDLDGLELDAPGEDLSGLMQQPTSEWDLDLQLDLLGARPSRSGPACTWASG